MPCRTLIALITSTIVGGCSQVPYRDGPIPSANQALDGATVSYELAVDDDTNVDYLDEIYGLAVPDDTATWGIDQLRMVALHRSPDIVSAVARYALAYQQRDTITRFFDPIASLEVDRHNVRDDVAKSDYSWGLDLSVRIKRQALLDAERAIVAADIAGARANV